MESLLFHAISVRYKALFPATHSNLGGNVEIANIRQLNPVWGMNTLAAGLTIHKLTITLVELLWNIEYGMYIMAITRQANLCTYSHKL